MKRLFSLMLVFILAFVVALLDVRCKKDDGTPTEPPTTDGTVRTAQSVVVRSNEEATLTHPAGSRIVIPQWAVPPTTDGTTGEMLFSIEVGSLESFSVPNTPPSGWQFDPQVHAMGPAGFIFSQPVIASIPLPSGFDPSSRDICMFDYDRSAGVWKSVGGRLSQDGTSLEVDAIHLCTNLFGSVNWSEKAVGAISFNTIARYSFKVCIESYQLKDPDYDRSFESQNRIRRIDRRDASTTPPDGIVYWRLPQGTWNLLVEVYYHDPSLPTEPPRYLGYFRRSISIDSPHWNWTQQMGAPDYEYAVPFGTLITDPAQLIADGTQPCFAPTPSVGVGALNVRLEWNAPVDLDLWVVDPCGNKIYWDHEQDTCNSSVGRLDLDNWCSNLVLGRPENIFWRTAPPVGTYKVSVNLYGYCETASTAAVYYTVRWTVKGATNSKSGTIQGEGTTILVTEFIN